MLETVHRVADSTFAKFNNVLFLNRREIDKLKGINAVNAPVIRGEEGDLMRIVDVVQAPDRMTV